MMLPGLVGLPVWTPDGWRWISVSHLCGGWPALQQFCLCAAAGQMSDSAVGHSPGWVAAAGPWHDMLYSVF
jgi:hypothetical protein